MQLEIPTPQIAAPINIKVLTYDGSRLGEYEFTGNVIWCYPCTKITSGIKSVALFALLKLPTLIDPHYVILKRNCAGRTDQLVVDELKPIFGLQKMGSHTIRLRGIPRKICDNYPWIIDSPQGQIINTYIYRQWSEYFVFRASTEKDQFGVLWPKPLPTFKDIEGSFPSVISEWKKGHIRFATEIQTILIFRELMRVGSTNSGDILIRNLSPLSIDETVIKELGSHPKAITQDLEGFFFPRLVSRTEAIVRMLGLTRDNYRDSVEVIRNSMTRVIQRVDGSKLWLVDDVINQLIDRCTIYYEQIDGS
jgi:hypothetical protein